MAFFQGIEAELGRDYKVWKGPRPIDIDILLYNQEVIDSPALQVPHQDLLERDFVVTPLLDIDPALQHPSGPLGTLARVTSSNSLKRVLVLEKETREVTYQIDDYQAYTMGIVNLSPDSFYDS